MTDIVGTAGPDTLVGTFGDDTIQGLGGSDTIYDGNVGGADVDTLDGGDGDDFITINDARDTIIGGAGFDTLFLGFPPGPGGISVNFFNLWATGSMAYGTGSISGIERLGPTVSGAMDNDVIVLGSNYTYDTILLGQEGNDILIGGSGNDDLRGFSGSDYLVGGAGNDILDGGLGATNTLQGGTGIDRYYVYVAGDSIVEFVDEGIDYVYTPLNSFVLPTNVERLYFQGAGPVVGIGNSGDNEIYGSAGADELFGLDGNDVLSGYDPNSGPNPGAANTFFGGRGDDQYYAYSTGDTIIELANEGFDIILTTAGSFTIPANVEWLVKQAGSGAFIGLGNVQDNQIIGADSADLLIGYEGNDQLQGGSGPANTLIGGAGDDSYFTSTSGDTIIELANEGIDFVEANISVMRLPQNVENLRFIGIGSFTGFGNAENNSMQIFSGSGTLFGFEGDDVLLGGRGGINTLIGGTGNDQYNIGAGSDTVLELAGEGVDVVIVSLATGVTAYTLPNNVENLIFDGIFGNVTSYNGVGNGLDNHIVGSFGDDTLSGLDGNDNLVGSGGNDNLYGGNGSDLLQGGDGSDRHFFLGGETGIDQIFGFTSGSDTIYLNRSGFGATAATNFVVHTGTMVAPNGNSTVFFNTGTGVLSIDPDGNGAAAAYDFAQIMGGLPLTAVDVIFY